jgi:hypothetical protein
LQAERRERQVIALPEQPRLAFAEGERARDQLLLDLAAAPVA